MKRIAGALLVCLFLLTGCGGPSKGVVSAALAEFFGDANAAQFIELDDFSTESCELTQNDQAGRGISERWVARFTLSFQGKVDNSIRGAILERRSSDGHWYINPLKFGC